MHKIPKCLHQWNNLDTDNLKVNWKEKFHISFDVNGFGKFINRDLMLQECWGRLLAYVPEYMSSTHKKVIDISSGSGMDLEILRYFGHTVFGVDFFKKEFKDDFLYKALLESQKVPYIVHDCASIPYPIGDKSYDLLINIGALHFYAPISNWGNILNEFARIATETIFLWVNAGPHYDEGKKYIEKWKCDGWKLVLQKDTVYKWKHV